MSLVNYATKEITCKIVYYGTGMGGKTTNLRVVHQKTDPKMRGKLLSLETETERTLFFDFVPLSVGKIKGFDTRFSFYTVPGQSFYNLTRKAILKDVDGIAFIADSQELRMEANIDSILNLGENLLEHNIHLKDLPHVIQYNKRDLEEIVPTAEMRVELNRFGAPDFEAIAIQGRGVFETLRTIVTKVAEKVVKELNL